MELELGVELELELQVQVSLMVVPEWSRQQTQLQQQPSWLMRPDKKV
jgi:hypothetical protein